MAKYQLQGLYEDEILAQKGILQMFENLFHIDINQLVTMIGYVGILAIIFAETGLFFGFFLPGDSLIFTAGILAYHGVFNLYVLMISIVIVAILGYTVGYWFGGKLGHWLIKREDSFWYKRKYLEKARDFYDRHGGKSLILARLVPIVRTFVPIVAGMVDMPFKKYTFYNVIGALVWGAGLCYIGYYIGSMFPNASHFLLPIVAGIILLSFLPAAWHLIKERSK